MKMEKRLVVDEQKLDFEGLFDIKELYHVFDSWFQENGYDKREYANLEKMTSKGKYVEWDLRPWRTMSDYNRFEMKIQVRISEIMDVVVEKDGVKKKLSKGKINMIFQAWLQTDIEGLWDSKPLFYFIHQIFDKYLYRSVGKKMEEDLVYDVKMVRKMISTYLNIDRH